MSRNRAEEIPHGHIVQWLRWLGPRLDAIPFHPANGGARSKVEAAIFKRLGVLAGVADLILLRRGSLCLEVKAKDGRQTPAQIAFEAECRRLGIAYHVVRDIDEAQKTVTAAGLVLPFGPITDTSKEGSDGPACPIA